MKYSFHPARMEANCNVGRAGGGRRKAERLKGWKAERSEGRKNLSCSPFSLSTFPPFSLPPSPPALPLAARRPPLARNWPTSCTEPGMGKARVLIVEDNSDVRRLYAIGLNQRGYEV